MTRERVGALLCLVAAAAYSSTAVFAKFAYEAGIGVVTLLAIRYALAAAAFWGLVARTRPPLPSRQALGAGLLLGVIGYSAQSGLLFSAFAHLDAALALLLFYSYPTIVMVVAVLLGRERPSTRRIAALIAASGGVALVLAGSEGARRDGLVLRYS